MEDSELCVCLRVDQIHFDALLVLPEGVAFQEFAIMSVHAMLGSLVTRGHESQDGTGGASIIITDEHAF